MCRIACPVSAGCEGTKSMTKNKPEGHGREVAVILLHDTVLHVLLLFLVVNLL